MEQSGLAEKVASKAKVKQTWADPARGYATYLTIKNWVITLWIAALAAFGAFAALSTLLPSQPWLKATIAEGVVLAVFFLIAAPILTALIYFYMGRILKARIFAEGTAIQPAKKPERATHTFKHWLILLALIALFATLLWFEYHYQTPIAERRNNPATLDRALFGDVSPSYAGVVGFVIIAVLTFMARGFWQRRGHA